MVERDGGGGQVGELREWMSQQKPWGTSLTKGGWKDVY